MFYLSSAVDHSFFVPSMPYRRAHRGAALLEHRASTRRPVASSFEYCILVDAWRMFAVTIALSCWSYCWCGEISGQDT